MSQYTALYHYTIKNDYPGYSQCFEHLDLDIRIQLSMCVVLEPDY